MIQVTCDKCKRRYNAPDKAAGRTVKCPQCKIALTVPDVLTEIDVVEEPGGGLEILDGGAGELEILDAPAAPAPRPVPQSPRPAQQQPAWSGSPAAARPAAAPAGLPQALVAPMPLGPPVRRSSWGLWAGLGGGAVAAVLVGLLVYSLTSGSSDAPADSGGGALAGARKTDAPSSTTAPQTPQADPLLQSPSTAATGGPTSPAGPTTSIPGIPSPAMQPGSTPAAQPSGTGLQAADLDPLPQDLRATATSGAAPLATSNRFEEVLIPTVPSRFVAAVYSDGSTRRLECWNLATGKTVGEFPVDHNFREGRLSPDGRLAAYKQNRNFREAVEILDLKQRTPLWTAESAEREQVAWFDFLDGNTLATVVKANFETKVRLWDLARQAKKSETPLQRFNGDVVGISAGGKLLALVDGRQLIVIRTADGQVALRAAEALPFGAFIGRIDFSPDGRYLAACSRGARQMYLVDLLGEQAVVSRALPHGSLGSAGPVAWKDAERVQWRPDGKSFLLGCRAVVERETGQIVWQKSNEWEAMWLLPGDRLLAITKGEGFRTPAALRVVSLENEIRRSTGAAAGPGKTDAQGEIVLEGEASDKQLFERSSRAYVVETLGEAMADDKSVLAKARWFPVAKRPVFGLRWGLGIHSLNEGTLPKIESARDIEWTLGPLPMEIGKQVQTSFNLGDFGKWPEGSDPAFRQVSFLGARSQEKLLSAGRRQALDMVVLIGFQDKQGPRGDAQVRVRFVDLASGKPLYATQNIPASVGFSRRGGASPVEQAIEQAIKRINLDFCLKPMPEMTAEAAKARVAALGLPDAQPACPLPALFELRYYQAKQLLTAEELVPLYDAILGKGKGKPFASGDKAQRKAIVDEWAKASEKP